MSRRFVVLSIHPALAALLVLLAAGGAAATLFCEDYGGFPGAGIDLPLATPPTAVATYDRYRYVARGASGVDVIDTGASGGPNIVSNIPGQAESLALDSSGSCLWIGRQGTVTRVDVTDPANPVVRENTPAGSGPVANLALSEDTAPGEHTLLANDGTVTMAIRVLAGCGNTISVDTAPGPPAPPTVLAAYGNLGVIGTADSVFGLDLTVSPLSIGSRVPLAGVTGATIRDASRVVLAGSSIGLQVWDFTGQPTMTGQLGLYPVIDILGGRYHDVLPAVDAVNGFIHGIDVSNPLLPVRAWSVKAPDLTGYVGAAAGPDEVSGDANLSVLTDTGTFAAVHDIKPRNNQSPPVLKEDARPFVPSAVDFLPGFQVAAIAGAGSTWVCDTTVPADPVITQSFESPAATAVKLFNGVSGLAMVVGGLADFRVVDLGNGTTATLSGASPVVAVSPDGMFGFRSDVFGNFTIVDLSDPANPVDRGSGSMPGSVTAVSMDNTTCVVASSSLIAAFDFTNPDAVVTTHTAPVANVTTVMRSPTGTHHYLSGPNIDTEARDFSGTGGTTVQLGTFSRGFADIALIDSSTRFRATGPELVYGVDGGTMTVTDWTDPTAPVYVGEYSDPALVLRGVAPGPETVLLADNSYPGRMLVLPAHGAAGATAAPPSPSPEGAPARLGNAWPNPFAGGTRLPFTLSRGGTVELSVHDVTGRLVRTLASGTRSAGGHAPEWDGRDASGRPVASGVYFVRLRAEGAVERAKLVRLR